MANVYNKPIVVVGGGGDELPVDNGAIYEGKYRVRYFDIDGTVLKIEYVAEGGTLNPPSNPNYDPDYLIFDEWNYDIENYTVERPTDVGATYKTVDDATYMFCRFTNATGLNPTLAISGFTSINWGDGTVDTNVSHTYAEEGEYLIKIYGNITFNTSSSTYLMGSSTLNATLNKFYLKDSITTIQSYCFYNCTSLNLVSLSKELVELKAQCFNSTNIKCIIFPFECIEYGRYLCGNCNSLKTAVFGQQSWRTAEYMFYQCYNLKNCILHVGKFPLQSISQYAFYKCGLEEFFIPKNETGVSVQFGAQSLGGLINMKNIFIILSNNIPSITINTFSSINASTIFWINDDIIENLKVATNWSTYASQMKPLSWYPSLTDPNAE